jgi:hypothetical protein
MPRSCRTCGTPLSQHGRTHCDDCLPEFRSQQRSDFSAAGPKALTQLRQAGSDPTQGAVAGQRRAETMRRHHRQAAEDREPADPDLFAREILPAIQTIPLRRLAAAIGLSLCYCALIRAGERVPRPQHWAGLAETALASESPTATNMLVPEERP